MKRLAKILYLIISLSTLLSLVSCIEIPENSNSNASIKLSQKSVELTEIGQTHELTAEVLMFEATENESVTWRSSNPAVATCENGIITAVGYGACVVRASIGTVSAACTVTIPNPNPILTITETNLVFDDKNETKVIKAISDEGKDISSSVKWESSNPKVATCNRGVIESKNYGVCTITVKYKTKTEVCVIEVPDPDAPSLALSANNMTLEVEEAKTLTATKNQTAGESVSWITSDASVASVDQNGVVKGVGNGACAIIAITEKGTSDACVVTVGNYVLPTLPPEHAEFVDFSLPNVGEKILTINRRTGQVTSVAVVVSYNLASSWYRYDAAYGIEGDNVKMTIELNCVKIYDTAGPGGVSTATVTTELYKDGNILCEKRIYKKESISIGETFKFGCTEFTINCTPGEQRTFRMDFSKVTELY